MPQPAISSPDVAKNPRSMWTVSAIYWVWITFFFQQFIQLFHMAHTWQTALTVLGTLVFFGLYIGTAWSNAGLMPADDGGQAIFTPGLLIPIVAMALLSVIMTLFAGPAYGGLFIYTTAITAGRVPIRLGFWLITVLAIISVGGAWRIGLPSRDLVGDIFTVLVTGFTTLAMHWAFETNRALRRARRDSARLAVAEERLRFARDLHDLLGHSLSLITLKSELAGRLMTLAPERAAREIADIEAAARQALHEVRDAVAGYRQPTLEGEIQAAREMLQAAGIAFERESLGISAALKTPQEALLGWAVREGVTNIIRHSRARTCTIRVVYAPEAVSLNIENDGVATGLATQEGNGLRGLRERAVALGGDCEAAPTAGNGFVLTVMLPMSMIDGAGQPAPMAEGVAQ